MAYAIFAIWNIQRKKLDIIDVLFHTWVIFFQRQSINIWFVFYELTPLVYRDIIREWNSQRAHKTSLKGMLQSAGIFLTPSNKYLPNPEDWGMRKPCIVAQVKISRFLTPTAEGSTLFFTKDNNIPTIKCYIWPNQYIEMIAFSFIFSIICNN